MLEFFLMIALACLGCLFPALLVDAIRAEEDKNYAEKRYKAGACFGAILLLIVWILK